MTLSTNTPSETVEPRWQDAVKPFRQPILAKTLFQLITTTVAFFVMWYLMYLSLDVSYALTLLLSVPTAGLVVRIFIFSHDCGHGAFFKSQKANDIVGFWTGVIAYTPYLQWRADHARHHKTSGQIEERGTGYFWCMGLQEFNDSPWYVRAYYRFYRHPFILFTIGGLWLFIVEFRFVHKGVDWRTRRGVYAQNLIYAGIIWGLASTIGLWNAFLIQMPICVVAAIAGLWLFYAQHHYEGSYWAPKAEWSFEDSALKGSSYLKLGPIGQWFAGNINFHHIHHLAPKVPNYRLEEAHNAVPMFNRVPHITSWQAWKWWNLRLVDEANCKWVDFPEHHKQEVVEEPDAPEAVTGTGEHAALDPA